VERRGTAIALGVAMWTHLVTRSYAPLLPLRRFERCAWLWGRLRRSFPSALDVILMPDGVHLVVETDDPEAARHELRVVLRGFTRRYRKGPRLFEPVPEPRRVPNRLHQQRTSRYVPLNPCRDGRARDPLEWLWSSYRDVMGATVDPWVTAERLARAHSRPRRGFEQWLHRYVSSDPDVAVEGTPIPLPAPPTAIARFPLERIQLASAAATRVLASTVPQRRQPRRLFIALARDQGWPNAVIAKASGMSIQNVRRVSVPKQALAAARLCLNDDRLLFAVNDLHEHE
jgi:hypothetical protein